MRLHQLVEFYRRHKNCVFCQFLDDLPPPNPAYITSLRISWAERIQVRRSRSELCQSELCQLQLDYSTRCLHHWS